MDELKSKLWMISVRIMGRNLILNMADQAFSVTGYDEDRTKVKSLRTESESKFFPTKYIINSAPTIHKGLSREMNCSRILNAGEKA
jgi:6-phosphogluconate dehydrogenase